MKAPGFTAEAGLQRTTRVWTTGEISAAQDSIVGVVPQFAYCFGHPRYGYICCEPFFGVCWRPPSGGWFHF